VKAIDTAPVLKWMEGKAAAVVKAWALPDTCSNGSYVTRDTVVWQKRPNSQHGASTCGV